MNKPVFILAFAYDPVAALPGVIKELQSLERHMSDWGGATIITRWQATQEVLSRDLVNYRDELVLFHYSGHASGTGFELNSDSKHAEKAYVEGVAGLLGMCPNIKLAFLNGCSTEDQAKHFTDNNVPAVIATNKPLDDELGLAFAKQFYKEFLHPFSKQTLKEAFDTTINFFKMRYGKLNDTMLQRAMRGSFDLEEDSKSEEENIYELHPEVGTPLVFAEHIMQWLELKEPPKPDEPHKPKGQVQTEVQNLIGAGKLEAALNLLVDHHEDAPLLKARFTSVKNQQMMGLVSFSDFNMEQNRISYSALELSKMLG